MCNHAIQRWRSRAAEYADASEHDIVKALRRSKLVKDVLPFPRKPNTCYYFDGKVYFIVEPIDAVSCRVVTMLTHAQQRAYSCYSPPTSKRERQRIKDLELAFSKEQR